MTLNLDSLDLVFASFPLVQTFFVFSFLQTVSIVHFGKGLLYWYDFVECALNWGRAETLGLP